MRDEPRAASPTPSRSRAAACRSRCPRPGGAPARWGGTVAGSSRAVPAADAARGVRARRARPARRPTCRSRTSARMPSAPRAPSSSASRGGSSPASAAGRNETHYAERRRRGDPVAEQLGYASPLDAVRVVVDVRQRGPHRCRERSARRRRSSRRRHSRTRLRRARYRAPTPTAPASSDGGAHRRASSAQRLSARSAGQRRAPHVLPPYRRAGRRCTACVADRQSTDNH